MNEIQTGKTNGGRDLEKLLKKYKKIFKDDTKFIFVNDNNDYDKLVAEIKNKNK